MPRREARGGPRPESAPVALRAPGPAVNSATRRRCRISSSSETATEAEDPMDSERFEARTVFAEALAAGRRSSAHLARLHECIRQMSRNGHSRQSFAEADLDFHLVIGDATGNPMMRLM